MGLEEAKLNFYSEIAALLYPIQLPDVYCLRGCILKGDSSHKKVRNYIKVGGIDRRLIVLHCSCKIKCDR